MWDYERIDKIQRDKSSRYQQYSQEQLIDRIVELETQLYPYYLALKPITENSWRGTWCSSKLFPLRTDNDEDKFQIYDSESQQIKEVEIEESNLHKVDYFLVDGISVDYGEQLDDSFYIIAFHQQAPGAYIGNGSISVGDIRRTIEIFNK